MKPLFIKGQKVTVKCRGKVITGTVKDWDYNLCTFEREYSVDYKGKDGKNWTMIGVPENQMKLIP